MGPHDMSLINDIMLLKLNISCFAIGFWQVNWRSNPYFVPSKFVVNNEKKVLDSKVSQLYFASLNPGRLMTGKNLKIILNTAFDKKTVGIDGRVKHQSVWFPVEQHRSTAFGSGWTTLTSKWNIDLLFFWNHWSRVTSGTESLES